MVETVDETSAQKHVCYNFRRGPEQEHGSNLGARRGPHLASPAWSQHIQTRSAAALAHRAVRTGSRGAGEAAARAIWARAEHSHITARRGHDQHDEMILRAVHDEQYLVV